MGPAVLPGLLLLTAVLTAVTGCGEGRSAGFVPYSETSAAPVENLRTDPVRPLTPVSASSSTDGPPDALSGSQVTEVPESPAPPGGAASQRPADGSPAAGSPPTEVDPAAARAPFLPAPSVRTGDSQDAVVSQGSSGTGIDPTPSGDNPPDTLSSATVPDSTVPDSTVPDSTVPDSTVPDSTVPNSTVADSTGAELPVEPRTVQLLIPEKLFRPERNSPAVRVTYDDIDLLKILNMEPVPVDAPVHFPEWLRQLDGTTIRIRGFMYPTFEATGLTAFTLARDNGICCFVRQPKIYDIIAVELASGVTSDYIENKPFDVEGTFRIQPEADEKELFRLYRIENARVLR